MIYGIGHDVLDMKRMDILMTGPHGEKFMERVLTQGERIIAARKGAKRTEFVAGRFAAKEAISKSFGCGIGRLIGFWDIEVLPNGLGKPIATLSKEAWTRLGIDQPADYTIHLTISHQTELASAFAVVETL
ncbi:holo-acyl-carrier-protein synthase [Paenibacillus vortex V453]|uniref:Holo-[acyl-carrier-protein] synthase n=2 Tax=Paenibacillus TaxID=44249 RepID=A0A163K057_9BACL|nr:MULTISPECIES: holo-ACP synthase [Paenibacillus]ANA80892.1 4'-phosphopantetheinyl transferase [Paenibacillus glucanolyticus]AVV55036.1 holo-[acyl-carrier-protein] synthase [Paenibacillus glucanolyticus]AWP29622.1 holo-[acyl-carrier-protein] synthase [Paenibacillus sp. Cedars]EFU42866.1 holo-acyl-carrier-protein synthase [Paenibacillus vortex V453]ETT40605.1 holo-acyl-carrier-protein synthase [Paenibacillus sp. FSL R5-808]